MPLKDVTAEERELGVNDGASPVWRLDASAAPRWLSWSPGDDDSAVRPGDGVARDGTRFVWTPLHSHAADLNPMRARGDPLMDEVVPLVPPGADFAGWLTGGGGGEAGARLRRQVEREPDWLDWDLVARGQDFYLRHGFPIGISLFNYALVGGYSAPELNRVLDGTGYLRSKRSATYRRLMETFKLVYDCNVGGVASLRPGGTGWLSAVRVRFLHARVRRMLQRRCPAWNTKVHGVPINQEDTMFTQLGFGFIVQVSLATMGFRVSEEDREAYVHLWRYVGHLMGVDEETNPCRSYAQAKATTESLVMHQIEASESGRRLAEHALRSVADYSDIGWSFERHVAISRELMGAPLADSLGLPVVPRVEHLHARFLFWSFRAMRRVLPNAATRALSLHMLGRSLRFGVGDDPDQYRFEFQPNRDAEPADKRIQAARAARLARQARVRAFFLFLALLAFFSALRAAGVV